MKDNSFKFFNKGISTPVGIIVIVVAAVIAGALMWYLAKSMTEQPIPALPTPSPTASPSPTSLPAPSPTAMPTPTPPPDETAGWKTYTNEEYGFEIKYPPIWESVEEEFRASGGVGTICIPEVSPSGRLVLFGPVLLMVKDSGGASLSEYVDRAIKEKKAREESVISLPFSNIKSRDNITFSGKNAIKIIYSRISSNKQEEKDQDIYVLKDNQIFHFFYSTASPLGACQYKPNQLSVEVAEQLLSTFRFLE